MGRSGSSSKRKSSKKKMSKNSSEARRKKRSRRNKSKKLRRHDDSISSYSNDESTSSFVSSSSSEDDYKSRRARSSARGDVKGSRKRARRSSSSQGCSRDSPHVKKRKGSKRKSDSEARNKRLKKKKTRRDANISSASSDSRSCSTCSGGSSSGGKEREFERPRGRSREKKKDKRDSSKGRSGNRKSKNRSRSCSSCSKLSGSDANNSNEKFAIENNSRRLRSVITVVKQQEEKEGYEVNKDELKEEIVYDHDDYPSCRSNDSNDGGNKRELAHHSYLASENIRSVENVMGEVPSVSNLITAKPTSSGKIVSEKYDGHNLCSDGAGNTSPKDKESDASATIGSDGDNLESSLRQKALENLSRFRGRLQTNAVVPVDEKNKSDGGVEKLSTAKAEFVQSKPPKQEGYGMTGVSQTVVQRSRFTWKRDSSVATRTEEKVPHEKHYGTDCRTAKHTVVRLPDKAGISGGSEEKDRIIAGAVNYRSVSNRPQASKLRRFPQENSSLTNSAVNKTADETSKTTAEIGTINHDVGIGDARGSTALETPSCISAEEQNSRDRQNETKDSSQFEQKTMSVMRGGEMVQVSYKVYIPKKAPALARRQLKR